MTLVDGFLRPMNSWACCAVCGRGFDPVQGHQCRPLEFLDSREPVPDLPPETKPSNPKDAAADNRIPLWLLSGVAKIHWALAQFAGMRKYGAWNWRAAGVRTSVYLSAIERHLEGIKAGETVDPVDGTDHYGNIMACCAIILDAREAGKLVDDRPPKLSHRAVIAKNEALMVKLREQYKDRNPKHYTIEDTP